MLREIYVKNFVLIDELRIPFDEHMSAFTGETGAGKSLLMDAISVLKGERVQTSFIREGQEKAIVEGLFEVDKTHPVVAKLEEAGFELEEGSFIVTRECSKAGKSVARINQRMVSASFLKEVVSSIVDIHSQHETQYLLNPKYHLALLDKFAQVDELKTLVATSYKKLQEVQAALEQALSNEYSEDALDLYTQQMNTIEEANLVEGELEQLEDELRCMQAYEKISNKVQNVISMMQSQNDPLTTLYEAYRELDSIQEDSYLQEQGKQFLDAYYQVEQVISDVKHHYDCMSFDERRFHEVQERIFLIHNILKRYGPTIKEVIAHRDFCEQRIDQILHRADFIKKQEILVQKEKDAYEQVAMQLHKKRIAKAKELETMIVQQLKDLQLPHARFVIDIQPSSPTKTGMDEVVFQVSMNPGEPVKSLSSSASGGELSRFMLGLKTVFSTLQGIETIIFDEIDTGVSGSVAFAVGKKMQQLSSSIQVFTVTHLASVAACANHHYLVEKHQDRTSTTTNIRLLDYEERIDALALISSSDLTTSSRSAAKELLDKAQQ